MFEFKINKKKKKRKRTVIRNTEFKEVPKTASRSPEKV